MKKIFSILGSIAFVLFLFWSRFYQLNILPASLTHDETIYAANAKSYILQGKDLAQTLRPWSLKPIHPMYAEWPTTIMSFGFLFSQNALLATHFSSAIMGVLFPFIFGWLIWGIWKNKQLAIIGTIVAGTNPLMWQFSRLSYDTFYSVFFYFLGGAIFVNFNNKKRWWSLPFLIIGFFQYQGLKLLLFPWTALLFSLQNNSFKKVIGQLFKPAGLIMINTLIVSFIYGLFILPHQQTNNRFSHTILSDTQNIIQQVDTDRRLSLISPLGKIFINKITYRGWFMADRFLSSFDPNLIFRFGEPNTTGFAVWTHGIFYLIDGVLILLGISVLLQNKKNKFSGILIILSVLIFSVPNLINTMSEWHIPRTFMAYTMLLILISHGASFVWKNKITRVVLGLIYLLSILYFSYQYFYRYPVTHLDAGTWDERIFSHYASIAKKDTQVWIYTDTPDMTFYNYLLYTNSINKNNLTKIRDTIYKNKEQQNKLFSVENIVVTNSCINMDQNQNKVLIWKIGHSFCRHEGEPDEVSFAKEKELLPYRLTIPATLDSGEAYRIYGDEICQEFKLSPFVHLQKIDDLNLTKMTTQQFCQKWITDLRNFN